MISGSEAAGVVSTARIERKLVHLVYLVYLVGLSVGEKSGTGEKGEKRDMG